MIPLPYIFVATSSKVLLLGPKTTSFTPFFTACLNLKYKTGRFSLISSAQTIIVSDVLRSEIVPSEISSLKNPSNKLSSFR